MTITLPPLPIPSSHRVIGDIADLDIISTFSSEQLQAYGQACADAAAEFYAELAKPPQPERQPMTDDEVRAAWVQARAFHQPHTNFVEGIRAAERHHEIGSKP